MDCLWSEYEGRIAELQEQFGREHADKTRLQQELDQLQRDWDDQLNEAQVGYKFSSCVCVCAYVLVCVLGAVSGNQFFFLFICTV